MKSSIKRRSSPFSHTEYDTGFAVFMTIKSRYRYTAFPLGHPGINISRMDLARELRRIRNEERNKA